MAGLMRRLGSLAADQRPRAGQVINEVKEAISGRIDERRAEFEKAERRRRLAEEKLDITLPGRPLPRGGCIRSRRPFATSSPSCATSASTRCGAPISRTSFTTSRP